jgi:D-glycero-D-manno-heptose 1,7-bisphosphate phosphatase
VRNHAGIFLDRDGTVNEEVEYLSSPKNLRLIPGAARAIREANELGFRVFIVTNQSGVARGFFTEEDVRLVNAELLRLLKLEGASIDAVYYCPHLPQSASATGPIDPRYLLDCDCRKPKTGMFEQAAKEFDIDFRSSFVVGDRLSDMKAGNNIGARSILVLTGYGLQAAEVITEHDAHIDYTAPDLAGAMAYIKQVAATGAEPARR